MTEELPNFTAVTLAEAIDSGMGGATLRDWVIAENARRAQAEIDYRTQPVEVAGIMLTPGDCANLTVADSWSKRQKRYLNCIFRGQVVVRGGYAAASRSLAFTQYGAKEGGWPKSQAFAPKNIVGVEKVPTPGWIAAKIEGEQA